MHIQSSITRFVNDHFGFFLINFIYLYFIKKKINKFTLSEFKILFAKPKFNDAILGICAI